MFYAQNKKAGFEYIFEEVITAGLVLNGKQAALIRARKATIPSSYVVWQNHRLELINVGLSEHTDSIPLLLDQKEVSKVRGALTIKGKTVIALNIKPVKRWIKVDIAIARGKKIYEKRSLIKQRDLDRETRKGLI